MNILTSNVVLVRTYNTILVPVQVLLLIAKNIFELVFCTLRTIKISSSSSPFKLVLVVVVLVPVLVQFNLIKIQSSYTTAEYYN